jgi:hypothetical protein
MACKRTSILTEDIFRKAFVRLLRGVVAAAAIALWSSAAVALDGSHGYRAGEFLNLDLPHAVLSPKPIGPASQFEPVVAGAKSDHTPPVVQARAPQTRPHHNTSHIAVRKHRNPLDAQAFDARIQVWPCRAGGICGWQTQPSR